ncbi:MAG TPA: HEPN domain-containing protein [Dehalococcoidia bacterium]|jgi:HEPN domain-containing protein|nr:HEPN domain-containing protein [Dehalococcoidia bacterium]
MGLEHDPAGSPAEWLRYARSDLELARLAPPPGVMPEALCFHAQQAAEKALKAVLIAHELPFPRTHNLRTLLDLLPQTLAPLAEVQDAARLTDYAVFSRYPAEAEPVTEEEHQEAVRLATAVLAWAEQTIGNL